MSWRNVSYVQNELCEVKQRLLDTYSEIKSVFKDLGAVLVEFHRIGKNQFHVIRKLRRGAVILVSDAFLVFP